MEAPFARAVAFASTVAILDMAACSRTPPEPGPPSPPSGTLTGALTASPASAASMAAAPASSGPALANRCIKKTAGEAPPVATAAAGNLCPPDPGPMKMATGHVSFPDAPNAPKEMEVELATTSAETARGLMFRRSMPADHGMLFDLRNRKVQAFWMHNTCIPLDMFFVDEDGLIVGILEQVPVLNDDERTVGCPSRYVLETNAGFARKHGIQAGQRLKLP